MKKCAVEVSFLSQFYEVVTMTRSLVVEAHDDVALCSLDFLLLTYLNSMIIKSTFDNEEVKELKNFNYL